MIPCGFYLNPFLSLHQKLDFTLVGAMKALFSCMKRALGAMNTIIGCSFDPENIRIYYTLNGKQVYSLTCKLDEFSNPLYPIIATNYDVTVLVTLGQSTFEYALANDHRVVDPCFKRPIFPSP